MATLGDINHVEYNITNGKSKSVKALYTVVCGDEHSRLNRSILKKFSGFPFAEGTEEFAAKTEEVKSKLTIADFVSICHILDISYSGTEEEIIKRILSYLCNLTKAKEDEDEEDEEEEEEEDEQPIEEGDDNHEDETEEEMSEVEDVRRKTAKINFKSESFTLSFRDVEDSIRRYDGKDGYPIIKWIQDFEDVAELMKWKDLQKLIFAKKSLDGLAKLLVQSERGITTWAKLKTLLLKEFEVQVNSADIHKLLMTRKKKKEETIQEYALIMREIGSRAYIEPEVIIQYIIDGIPEETNNKIVLYGAKTFEEFKNKIKLYNAIRLKSSVDAERKDVTQREKSSYGFSRRSSSVKIEKKCYNCGGRGHVGRDCQNKSLGTKCFKCNNFGHIAMRCPGRNPIEIKEDKKTVNCLTKQSNDIMHKKIRIQDHNMVALIDTGSDVNVIQNKHFNQLNIPEVDKTNIPLQGLGCNKLYTVGKFQAAIKLDEDEYYSTIHIVPDYVIPTDMIIGKEILKNTEMIMNSRGLKITKHQEAEENFLMSIQVAEEENAEELPPEIQELKENYHPKTIKHTNVQMKILLTDEIPIYQHPRRLSIVEMKEVDRQIEEWLKEGIIRPSTSEFASPIVLVKKKNGKTRICVDYRKINKKIIKDRYPLPLIEDQLDRLRGAKIFSTLDLRNGFFHVPVTPESIKYTSFVTPNGQYEFLKTPFGLCNSPASFQRYIKSVFNDLIQQGILLSYMDDLNIPSATREEGLEKLKIVLDRAAEFGLQINWSKCQFLQQKIEFLGYSIENNAISPSETKTYAVMKFPKPTTLKQIQSFLGLTGYFRKFIPKYSQIAKPLSDLLKKNNSFTFGPEQENSFEILKKSLSTKPVLRIYSPNNRTELHTDASMFGYGAILLQEDDEDGKLHPIYYFSRKTSEAEQKYSSYELEVLAIIESLKKFRVYLLGIEFKIITDCSAFEMTMKKKDLTTRVARWALLLEEYHYKIEHRSGDRMKHADALSRNPTVMLIENEVVNRIKKLQQEDENLNVIFKLLKSTPHDHYLIENQLLYKQYEGRNLLVVPKMMQYEIIKKAHEHGHFGTKKTEELILREFWIPKLKEKINNFIRNCIPCILTERKSGKQEGFLNPIDKGDSPLETYHVDHLGPLTTTKKGYKHILVVVDAFSKFVWLYATKTTTTSEAIDKLNLQAITFGNPRRIITDRGTCFTSNVFGEYCKENHIKHIQITTGVPRGNGQVERINRIIIPSLTKLSIDKTEEWYKYLGKLQVAINNTFQRSLQKTPFEIMIGVKMRSEQDTRLQEIIKEEIIQCFEDEREELRQEAKLQIKKVQEENIRTFNKKRKPAQKYKIGDLVAIKRSQFLPNSKIRTKFLGPYQISDVRGFDRYALTKISFSEGPKHTYGCADQMKPWRSSEDVDENASEADEIQDGRDVGERDN